VKPTALPPVSKPARSQILLSLQKRAGTSRTLFPRGIFTDSCRPRSGRKQRSLFSAVQRFTTFNLTVYALGAEADAEGVTNSPKRIDSKFMPIVHSRCRTGRTKRINHVYHHERPTPYFVQMSRNCSDLSASTVLRTPDCFCAISL